MPPRRTIAIAFALLIVLTPAALAPIRSYDFFWHRATGRWIVDHHALPLTDPFAVASDKTAWINGEWLFEVLIAPISPVALTWLKAVFVAATFAAGFLFAARQSDWTFALLVTALAFAAAWDRLDVRPSTAAAALLMLAIALVDVSDIGFVLLTILWINVHPSALLAPVIALIARRMHWLPLASALALLVNPFGWRAIAAPVALTRFAGSGAFVNAEWLPSPFRLFPLLYVCVAVGVIVFAIERREIWRMVVFALLAYLAIAHVRNQGLFLAAFPLLVVSTKPSKVWPGLAIVLFAYTLAGDHAAGIARHRFPIEAVAKLKASGLQGNIYNPDQFGGYIIDAFYPQRRALTDGRNELYHTYIAEYAKARRDSRAWHALLRKYDIRLAIDEYRPPLDVIDAKTGRHRTTEAWKAYWPENEWEMIGRDDVAMLFAKRR